MLHEVPDSPYRSRLLEIHEMQKILIQALCALPAASVVDLEWLKSTWNTVTDSTWLQRFWENNSDKRAEWCNQIAGAEVAIKRDILEIMAQQLRFAELYSNPPSVHLEIHSWKVSNNSLGDERKRQIVLKAVQNLLQEFYAPLFYKNEGFPNPDGSQFHKDVFICRSPKVCPYTDNKPQDTKLDHFFPKESFPFLSCHPDNLIPCSTDPNSVGRKGSKLPFDKDETDQAQNWFHPKFRSAWKTFKLTFDSESSCGPKANFVANTEQDQPRLDNMAEMFDLVEFWSRDLDDELQLVASEIETEFRHECTVPSTALVRKKMQRLVESKRARIGHDPLAIVHSEFYTHILRTPSLFSQLERTCIDGT